MSMIIQRTEYLKKLQAAVRRAPIASILGPRQCGKTTLAREFAKQQKKATLFDLENPADLQRLKNPDLVLRGLDGLVVLDEIQAMPELFQLLRVVVDRPENRARFLILGSASPDIIRGVSETLAGRVEFVDMMGFSLQEVGYENWKQLWLRGGFPLSYLAQTDEDSKKWREGFIRTFLERDIPQLGINIPATTMRRFWMMLAHYHGQTWNASELARSLALSDKTVRYYLDVLTGTFMVRQLQPWFENVGKRQVKAPKIYIRDSGLYHFLLDIDNEHSLMGNPRVGASWEGLALEEIMRVFSSAYPYFWATHSGAELDLVFLWKGKKIGFEVKFNEAPGLTKSMSASVEALGLSHLYVVYPGEHDYPMTEQITAWPLQRISELPLK